MSTQRQIEGLTIARGLAAWMVVLFHIRGGMPWLPDGVMAVLDKGYLAVDFFFLLSGFVIYLTAHRAFLAEGLAALPAFFRRRAARIVPLYAVMLALTTAFAALLTMTGRDHSGYPWAELPLHMLLLQNWGFTDALTWNHPAWSISTEFAAYLLLPVLILTIPLHRLPGWALFAGIAALIGIMAFLLGAAGLRDLGQDIPHFGIVRCLFEFSAGCLLCALWLRGRATGSRSAIFVAACVFIVPALFWSIHAPAELWAFPLIAAASIFLIASAPQARFPRAFLYLGEISYATYLSHFMLFIWFKIVTVSDPANIAPPVILLFLALSFAVSALLYHSIERPGRRLGTKYR
ncbi:MAG: acyltransferase [Sphingobium sp.]